MRASFACAATAEFSLHSRPSTSSAALVHPPRKMSRLRALAVLITTTLSNCQRLQSSVSPESARGTYLGMAGPRSACFCYIYYCEFFGRVDTSLSGLGRPKLI